MRSQDPLGSGTISGWRSGCLRAGSGRLDEERTQPAMFRVTETVPDPSSTPS